MTAPTCSEVAARLGVELGGTASRLRSWLLLETPGPWGEAARERAFVAALGEPRWAELRELWERAWLRPLVVRRPGRAGRSAVAEPALFVGSTADGRRWLERLPASALPGLDLEAVAAGVPGHGEPVDGPLLAVCTNGSVDRCCAVRGRPLVAALAAAHPDRTWEVSHVGGCQLAANLLVLPDAVMHGRLSPEDGLRIAAAAMEDRVGVEGLRGRCGPGPFAGAAEVALRQRLALSRYDDVRVLAEQPHDDVVAGEDGPEPAGADVLLSVGDRPWRAVLRTRSLAAPASACEPDPCLVTTAAVVHLDPA